MTTKTPIRVLLVEDSTDDAELVRMELETGGYDVTSKRVETDLDMSQALQDDDWDIVLSDYAMPRFDGRAALDTLKRSGLDIPFIIVSGTIGEETAVALMKAGASDYLLKDNLRRLCPAVHREVCEAASRRKGRAPEATVAQVRAAQRLEALGQLAGGIAHDFNNLLTVIQSCTGFLLEDLPEGDAAREDVTEIRDAAEHAARLTDQLLAFSRRQPQKLAILNLNQTLRELDKMLQRIIGEDIDLVTNFAADLDCVRADRSQIEQVLMNLAVNARDAMPKGGRLTIETANVELDETYGAEKGVAIPPDRYVMLAVTDAGIGMDAATQERIFEPFFTKKGARGTGLGLSTVYGIVKQSGGYIWVYSEVDKGTTFKIYLPRVHGLPSEPAPPTRVQATGGTETLLLVEDDEAVRRVAARMLRGAGYDVLEATGGDHALRLARQHEGRIALLLTDVVMPTMSGKEVATRLASTRPDLRVLFMSGYTDGAVVHHGVLEGGVDYVQKPFSREALLARVREVLDRHGPATG